MGSDEPVTIRSLAEKVAAAVETRAQLAIEHIPYTTAYAAGFEDIQCRVPDLTRIRETIDYRPQHRLDDIIREVVAWKKSC